MRSSAVWASMAGGVLLAIVWPTWLLVTLARATSAVSDTPVVAVRPCRATLDCGAARSRVRSRVG